VSDQPHSLYQQRAHAHCHLGVFHCGLPHQGLDRDAPVSFVDPIQTVDAVDVDQVRRPGQAEVEQWDQRLPAGKNLRVL
jgi:hypothetical protein